MASVSPIRGQRKNSPFTKSQEAWIILEFAALRNIFALRRKISIHFKMAPFKVPSFNAFKRLVVSFKETNGQVRPRVPVGRPPINEEMVETVREFFQPFREIKEAVSLSTMATSFGITVNMAWRIVRKKLGWYPFKPKNVVPLKAEHKAGRVIFYDWLFQQPEDSADKVLWSEAVCA